MKRKIIIIVLAGLFVLLFVLRASSLSAGYLTRLVYPKDDNLDVLVPETLIDTIQNDSNKGPDPNKKIYACTETNGWLEQGGEYSREKRLKNTEMTQQGEIWRAWGLRYYRFIPCQLDKDGKPIRARIDALYPDQMPAPGQIKGFIDFTDKSGPVLLVK